MLSGLLGLLGASCERSASEDPNFTGVIAYYFYNTIRCETCLKIEKTAKGVIEETFAEELEAGTLRWRPLNMELPENKHFVGAYELGMPTVVCSKVANGREVSWKNLDEVWLHLEEPGAIAKYVKDELVKLLRTPRAGELRSEDPVKVTP